MPMKLPSSAQPMPALPPAPSAKALNWPGTTTFGRVADALVSQIMGPSITKRRGLMPNSTAMPYAAGPRAAPDLSPKHGHDVDDGPLRLSQQARPQAPRSHALSQAHVRWQTAHDPDLGIVVVPVAPSPEALFALPASDMLRMRLAEPVAEAWERQCIKGLTFALQSQTADYAESFGLSAAHLARCITALMRDQGYFASLTRGLARDIPVDVLHCRRGFEHTLTGAAESTLFTLATTVMHRSPADVVRVSRVHTAVLAPVCQAYGVFARLTPAEIRPRLDFVAAHLAPDALTYLQTYLATTEGAAFTQGWRISAEARAAYVQSAFFSQGLSDMIRGLQASHDN